MVTLEGSSLIGDGTSKKLERVLSDVKSVEKGGNDLIRNINRDLKKEKTLGPLYEAEIVSHLKRSGWEVEEVEHKFKLHGDPGDIDIIAWEKGERVYIECKRSTKKISEEQLLKEAEYASMNGVKNPSCSFSISENYSKVETKTWEFKPSQSPQGSRRSS